jgi:hypothetical protein
MQFSKKHMFAVAALGCVGAVAIASYMTDSPFKLPAAPSCESFMTRARLVEASDGILPPAVGHVNLAAGMGCYAIRAGLNLKLIP